MKYPHPTHPTLADMVRSFADVDVSEIPWARKDVCQRLIIHYFYYLLQQDDVEYEVAENIIHDLNHQLAHYVYLNHRSIFDPRDFEVNYNRSKQKCSICHNIVEDYDGPCDDNSYPGEEDYYEAKAEREELEGLRGQERHD